MKYTQMDEYIKFCHKLALSAANETKPLFRKKVAIQDKANIGNFDPVTIADQNAEQIMRKLIKKQYPNHNIIGEEFANIDNKHELTWVIDPVDGTKSFIYGMPIWTTLIGLLKNDEPILGYVNQPILNETFYNHKEAAFYFTSNKQKQITTSKKEKLSECLMACTAPDIFISDYEQKCFASLQEKTKHTRFGGDAYFYLMLAAGHIDIVIEANLKPCDILPIIPIIKASGGIITDWHGKNVNDNGQVIASNNQLIHTQALEAISKHKNT